MKIVDMKYSQNKFVYHSNIILKKKKKISMTKVFVNKIYFKNTKYKVQLNLLIRVILPLI